ncbi:titin homolog [Patella vulgata]|uniref:titin homolog n=1 Tax=Patella vulgata TaxID=6465 RepID=UPI0024A9B9A5|nr:titin homolog [Patella vulgata]
MITVDVKAQPDLISDIRYSPPSDNSICITWTPGLNGGDQQEFIVEHSVDNKTWTSSTPLLESKPDYCIKNLQADTPYYIRVIARNKYGDSQPVYLMLSNGSFKVQTLKTVESPTSTGPNFGLIIGIIVCVGVVILIIILVVVLYKRRKRVNKKDGHDKEYAPNVHNHVTTTRQEETNAVVHDSPGEIKKDGTSTCTQVSQLKKTAETKPNPELLYATVNKTKTDETMKKDAQSKKPDIKSKKSNVKPTQINGKPNEKMTTKGDANENVGIFSNNHGMATSQYENHLIQKAKAETFKKKDVVYADLDFDGHHPTTAVRGQVNAVEYNGIDYTKRGPTQPTPPNSSDEEADNDK